MVVMRKKWCPIDGIYDCEKQHYPGELQDKLKAMPKGVLEDSISMPGDNIHKRQQAIAARERREKELKGE